MYIITQNIQQIAGICRKFNVMRLWAFGSVLTPRFNAESDIDLLVDFDKSKISLENYSSNFFGFQFELESLFNRRVDITENSAVKNLYFRQELDETKSLIYG
jgi:predicted nucleotidyltransferase